MFPIITILALLAIGGGVATLSWYSSLSKAEQDRANGMALQMFGKAFKELSEYQQAKIRDRLKQT